MAKIIRLKKKAYVVAATDISALVGYVNGVKGACAAKQAIEYLESQMPNRDWPAIVDAAVTQAKIIRSDRRLFTLSAWQSYQRRKSVKKGLISVAISISLFMVSHANPYVTNVVARQRLPWSGLVDVSYEIVGSTNGLEYAYGQLTATDRTRGKTYVASTFEKPIDLTEGKHTAIWNMAADSSMVSTSVVFSLAIKKPSLYCVIDLSGGPSATTYPVSELEDVPDGGWTDEYKTTKLVLKRINPGTFIRGGDQSDETHRVWLTKPFFIGVFEVTQKQYELIAGENPSIYKGGSRPVEHISWDMLRGDAHKYNWPVVSSIADESIIAVLRRKTMVSFDLPTDAQWEYACRAGTTSLFYLGDSSETKDLIGRWRGNVDDGKGGFGEYTTVGSYLPNAWGLYDMCGNVREWCLNAGEIDFDNHFEYVADRMLFYGVDPTGSLVRGRYEFRQIRGGGWTSSSINSVDVDQCISSLQSHYNSDGYDVDSNGFRLVVNLP